MDIQEMKRGAGTVEVTLDGKTLVCTVCGNNRYHERGALVNSRSGEFFGFAWADTKATNFICTNCGYIFWFLI
jgi:hypothetical protein